jgi:polyisoprenoid-binding protein YceI
MKRPIAILLALAGAASASIAAEKSFDFKDAKGVNNVTFKLDAPLEAISGSASGISGTVTFDDSKPATSKGRIVVTSKSLTVGNAMMQEHMHSEGWLDVAKHPEITFDVKELKDVKTEGNVTSATAHGDFTLKGVSKKISAPVKFTYLKGKLADRTGGRMKGDLLVIRSTFTIQRGEFGIKPGEATDKVSDAIELSLSIAGAAPEK